MGKVSPAEPRMRRCGQARGSTGHTSPIRRASTDQALPMVSTREKRKKCPGLSLPLCSHWLGPAGTGEPAEYHRTREGIKDKRPTTDTSRNYY